MMCITPEYDTKTRNMYAEDGTIPRFEMSVEHCKH